MGSFFLVNLCLVVITMQFQETKTREIELMENSKASNSLNSPRPMEALIRFMSNLCNCGTHDTEPRVHHHHHYFYHHHHYHHHMYNCFVPASPGMFSNAGNEPAFFSSPDMPKIKVDEELGLPFSSNTDQPELDQDFLAPPDRISRRNSKTSICSHTLSIHAETSSAVSIEEIVAQTTTSVTLNIPSTTNNAGFFAFASCNSASASRKNSGTGNAEVTAAALVSAEINPQHSNANAEQEKETGSNINSKDEHKPSIGRKDEELLKYRRFSQPAHIKLARTTSPGISACSPSERFDESTSLGDVSPNERNAEPLKFDDILPPENISLKDFATEVSNIDCQPEATHSTKKKSPMIRRNISTQSEDDMFDSLFNLRQSASYDVTVNEGAWQKLRALCRKVAASKQFTFLIMSVILLNMICMGLEHYQQVSSM